MYVHTQNALPESVFLISHVEPDISHKFKILGEVAELVILRLL
jgi:hypothetical protein